MFKITLIALSILTAQVAFSSDEFVCEVTKKVTYAYECTKCTGYNGDNDCVDDTVTTCIDEKEMKMNLISSQLHPTNEFFLSAKNDEAMFFVSQSQSGYSVRLTYLKDGSEVSFQNNAVLQPYSANITFNLKLKADSTLAGNVTALKLNCAAK